MNSRLFEGLDEVLRTDLDGAFEDGSLRSAILDSIASGTQRALRRNCEVLAVRRTDDADRGAWQPNHSQCGSFGQLSTLDHTIDAR